MQHTLRYSSATSDEFRDIKVVIKQSTNLVQRRPKPTVILVRLPPSFGRDSTKQGIDADHLSLFELSTINTTIRNSNRCTPHLHHHMTSAFIESTTTIPTFTTIDPAPYSSPLDPLTYLDTPGSQILSPPPLVSPSLLIPLDEEALATTSPSSLTGEPRYTGHHDTASQYQEVLEKLEHATLQDKQMLSSFKRESSRLRTIARSADQAEILRHGKHAQSSDQSRQPRDRKSAPTTATSPVQAQQPIQQQPQQQQYQQPAQPTYQDDMYSQASGQSASAAQQQQSRAPIPSPNYREEAEKIVADERAQSSQMPVYEVSRRPWTAEKSANMSGFGGLQTH